jgi:hypothetical protein
VRSSCITSAAPKLVWTYRDLFATRIMTSSFRQLLGGLS